jgi:hypothetical protein
VPPSISANNRPSDLALSINSILTNTLVDPTKLYYIGGGIFLFIIIILIISLAFGNDVQVDDYED